ncbi:hypothetical protein DPMN_060555 [Dreissena polymorpha]|uniref:Uncharacterized protein n=1 Tax=Dreissena polymorpha TaxID=45954 RepID=A0A9D4C5Z9_DREPO|nr:hypothetical protein DPMN_060555 [Dreissena polymorpha]
MTSVPETRTIFELIRDIIGKNCLTKFHEDLTVNLASRVKDARPPCGHFHEDRTINVTSRELKKQMLTTHDGQSNHKSSDYSAELECTEYPQDIVGINVLTKFHEDCAINVIRVLTIKISRPQAAMLFDRLINSPPLGSQTINVASRVLTRKNVLPSGGHVFQATGTIFELEKQALPPFGHVCQPNRTNFELVQNIFGINVLSKFHKALK